MTQSLEQLQRLRQALDHIEDMVVSHAAKENRYPSEYSALSAVNGWDQSEWRRVGICGTSMCLAGWVGELSGHTWAINQLNESQVSGVDRGYLNRAQLIVDRNMAILLKQHIPDRISVVTLRKNRDGVSLEPTIEPDGDDSVVYLTGAQYLARVLLGLDEEDADFLFAPDRTLGQMWRWYHNRYREARIWQARAEAKSRSRALINQDGDPQP